MNKLIINYFIVAGLSFITVMILLMSINTGFKKKGTIISIKGENVSGLSASVRNRYARNIPLEKIGSNNAGTEIVFFVPDNLYIRRVYFFQESNSGLRLKKISFTEGQNKITLKRKDIKNFFKANGYTFDPKTAQYEKINNTISNQITISSRDITNLLKGLYIKHLNSKWIVIFSLLASCSSVLLFRYSISLGDQTVIKRSVLALTIILISMPVTQVFLSSNDIDEILLDDSNTFKFFSRVDTENLAYNGDFRHGLIFWEAFADSTTHELIDTPYGPGIRVKRGDGDEKYFSLRYLGRPILYHQSHTYQIRFKYKIVKGEGVPFNVGWGVVVDRRAVAYKLKLNSIPLQDGWYEANAEYTFPYDAKNATCFLNSMKDNSEVLITDISIRDLTRKPGQIDFIDQQD